jgi:hypothetical protein
VAVSHYLGVTKAAGAVSVAVAVAEASALVVAVATLVVPVVLGQATRLLEVGAQLTMAQALLMA